MFSKKVKGKEIKSKIIESNHQKNKLSGVIFSLLKIGKRRKLKHFRLNDNCMECIEGLFNGYPKLNELYMRFLIRDFTNSMNTAMRTEDKYVVSILTDNRIILCHSKVGEKTITPNWTVIDRMLDKDNVIRFVSFEKSENELNVVFYENERTVFFVNWLGIPENEIFYGVGGKNRFYSMVHNIPITLELTDEDFERILDNKELKIENGIIKLPEQVREFKIAEIKRGNKPYGSTKDFLLEFIQRNYNLLQYREEYKKLKGTLDHLFSQVIEDEHRVKFLVDIQ